MCSERCSHIQISETMGLEFISFRVWVGFWLAIITFITVMFEGSILIRLFTRFIQEIFATLIALIFIIESFIKIAGVGIMFSSLF